MFRVLNILLLVSLSIFNLGCSKYSEIMEAARKNKLAHPEQRIFDGEVEPSFPNESDNDKSLLGIDSNNNGIRDDLDIWINFIGLNRNHRMSLRQLAKAENSILLADTSDSKSVSKAAIEVWDAGLCVMHFEKKFDFNSSPSTSFSKIFYNTNLRKNKYEKFNMNSFVYKPSNPDQSVGKEYLSCLIEIEK